MELNEALARQNMSVTYENSNETNHIGRFAPSPTGYLHLGNLFSYLIAYIWIKQHHGYMVMRIEDLDFSRSKQLFADALLRDLDWLGFEWAGEILYQSKRLEAYKDAFDYLNKENLLYPCFCSRAELQSASAPHAGEEVRYRNTCRSLSHLEVQDKMQIKNPSYRIKTPSQIFTFQDLFQGQQAQNPAEISGDFILKRSDGVFAYQLAVVLDDAYQGVTSVIRGIDLLPSVSRQMYLSSLLSLKAPLYGHVPLLVDQTHRRLSKRNQDLSLRYLRNELKLTPEIMLGSTAHYVGIIPEYQPMSIDNLVKCANLDALDGKSEITIKLNALLPHPRNGR